MFCFFSKLRRNSGLWFDEFQGLFLLGYWSGWFLKSLCAHVFTVDIKLNCPNISLKPFCWKHLSKFRVMRKKKTKVGPKLFWNLHGLLGVPFTEVTGSTIYNVMKRKYPDKFLRETINGITSYFFTSHNMLFINHFLCPLFFGLFLCMTSWLTVVKQRVYHYCYLPAATYISNFVARSFLPIISRAFLNVCLSNLPSKKLPSLKIISTSSPVSNSATWSSTKK